MIKYLIVLFTLIPFKFLGNMAEPVIHGSIASTPFTSQYVDILKEEIRITIDENFKYANFEIEYHIKSDINGSQIPLLFYAIDIHDSSFEVFYDGLPVEIEDVPYHDHPRKNQDFDYFFDHPNHSNHQHIPYDDNDNHGHSISIDNMRYFETDIQKGVHIITVNYIASCWVDQWDWINKYSFRYSLTPAKYWRSFGRLNISLDLSACSNEIFTNLPDTNIDSSVLNWEFDQLPVNTLMISYSPKISKSAKTLIKIGPFNLTLIISILLISAHLYWVKKYRISFPNKKYSNAVIIGGILVPLLFFILWYNCYSLIDWVIGEHATGNHGYHFLLFIFLPIVLPIYWLIVWLYDRYLRKILG